MTRMVFVTKRIILDCDPGHDDAIAILVALGCPDIELVAITTVAGNQTLEKTTLNARRVCTVAGAHDVPIYAGCWRPQVRPQVTAAEVHGESGLDGPVFGEPAVPVQQEHAVDYLVRTLMAEGEDITLVPTGPLTNVAAALAREPKIAARTREVVLMGGAYTRGNRTPAAEFNIFADPEAAAAVFGAGWPLTMVGLDLTHQAIATAEVVARIRALDTEVGRMVTALLDFYGGSYRRSGLAGAAAGPPVHDPCAVARVARPDLMVVRDAFVAVETRGEWTSGMTVTDFSGSLGRPPNAKVATTLDVRGFWDLTLSALQAFGASADPGAGPAGKAAGGSEEKATVGLEGDVAGGPSGEG
jgi:inosine-uridine nucleoside N-ribohydrolase